MNNTGGKDVGKYWFCEAAAAATETNSASRDHVILIHLHAPQHVDSNKSNRRNSIRIMAFCEADSSRQPRRKRLSRNRPWLIVFGKAYLQAMTTIKILSDPPPTAHLVQQRFGRDYVDSVFSVKTIRRPPMPSFAWDGRPMIAKYPLESLSQAQVRPLCHTRRNQE